MKHFALYKIYISLLLLGGGLILPFCCDAPAPQIKWVETVYTAFTRQNGGARSNPASFSFINDVIVPLVPTLKD